MVLLTKIFTNKYNIIISSLVLGFYFWYFLTTFRPVEITIAIPLTFYGEKIEAYTFESTESITITLKGLKNDLYTLQLKNLAAHINGDNLSIGENIITPTAKDLFLPDEIKLLCVRPSNVVICKKNMDVGYNG